MLGGVDQGQALGVAVDPALLHQLLQGGGIGLVLKLPLGGAGQGDDGVPVADGGDVAGVLADGLADLPGEILEVPQGGVFAEGDAALLVGVDLQRASLLDAKGVADLLGDDHTAKGI